VTVSSRQGLRYLAGVSFRRQVSHLITELRELARAAFLILAPASIVLVPLHSTSAEYMDAKPGCKRPSSEQSALIGLPAASAIGTRVSSAA